MLQFSELPFKSSVGDDGSANARNDAGEKPTHHPSRGPTGFARADPMRGSG
jgi:hypothetical protein